MSAIMRVVSGTADVRIGGVTEAITAPWEEAGVEYDPKIAKPETAESARLEEFKESVARAMRTQLECPMMGSASKPFKRLEGTVEVEAVDEPVFLLVYRDVEQSPHPDETFGQSKGFEESRMVLQPGEVWTGPVCEANAATVLVMTA